MRSAHLAKVEKSTDLFMTQGADASINILVRLPAAEDTEGDKCGEMAASQIDTRWYLALVAFLQLAMKSLAVTY